MVHWAFLILAFIAGAAGTAFLYQLAKARGKVTGAVKGGSEPPRFQE